MDASKQSLINDIPHQPGTYTLLYALSENRAVQVGKLGLFNLPAGFYLYVGSALGSGGLAGRLGRQLGHRRGYRPKHWHVDYLAAEATLLEITYTPDSHRCEHIWARRIQSYEEASIPVPKFGASDCDCETHLFHFPSWPMKMDLRKLLTHKSSGEIPIFSIPL